MDYFIIVEVIRMLRTMTWQLLDSYTVYWVDMVVVCKTICVLGTAVVCCKAGTNARQSTSVNDHLLSSDMPKLKC